MSRRRVWLIAVLGAVLFALSLPLSSAALAAGPSTPQASLENWTVLRCLRGASARCPNPLFFLRGATSARRFGRLFGINDKRFFTLRAHAGQHMKVTITGAGPTRGIVFFPLGGSSGMPGGVVFDEDLTQTGNYLIEVEESSMGSAWVGDFRLDISIH
jgi:hypothetical protein